MIDDLLGDPGSFLEVALSWATGHVFTLIWHTCTLVGLIAGVRAALARLRHRSLTRGARCVEILAPPTADMPCAQALWGNLVGLLRPAWKRLLFGQPHLAFEYGLAADGVKIRMWVPGPVPQYLVEHAIEAAWPSARTAVVHPAPPVPPGGTSTGGRLLLARAETLPLRDQHQTDPLRAVIGAAVAMPTWQRAAVQILARPATGRRLADFGGRAPVRLARAVLDLLTPGPLHRHPYQPPQLPASRVDRLEGAAWARATRDKNLQPRYEVAIRYAVQADSAATPF